MNDINKQRRDAERRVLIKNLFSPEKEMRDMARQELKDAWAHDEPSFREVELETLPAENASLMAAKRDGRKEVIDWLLKL